MLNVDLLRIENTETETVGLVIIAKRIQCYSLELPWKDNLPDISCIPCGKYKAFKKNSKFYIYDVPNRSGIIFGHAGNRVRDSKGCILLGENVIWMDMDSEKRLRVLVRSLPACAAFTHRLNDINELLINIKQI